MRTSILMRRPQGLFPVGVPMGSGCVVAIMAGSLHSLPHFLEAPNLSTEESQAINKIVQFCKEYISKNRDRNEPVVRFKTPNELEALINFPITKEGVGLKGIMEDIESTMKWSVRTGHVRFYNQLWAGTNLPAVLGEWLTAVMNSSMYTFEVSPVFSMMEVQLIQKVLGLIGWEGGDGVFAPGGAHCNLLALLAARHHRNPNIRKTGMGGQPAWVCFSSSHDHYTIQRAAGVAGIGEENCIKVPADSHGHMIPEELEKAIERAKAVGQIPFFLNATAGTTVLGAFDPLPRLAEIGKRHGLWCHVDACWGGHALLSPTHRGLLNGCELFDSVAWTATKCLGLPQQCAALLTKSPGVLAQCNAMGKDYLFHEHDQKAWDLGEKTLNCGRRVDAFKLWIAWKVAGDDGMAAVVDHAFDQAAHTVKVLQQREDFELLEENPESLNVCFWFIPPSARSLPRGSQRSQAMSRATVEIRKRMQREGKLLTNYSDLPGVEGHFFRHITCNPGATPEDMEFVISEIARLGADL